MTMTSARHALPLLQAGQAQKELYHNEALVLLDLAVHAVVQEVGRNEPPELAEPGQTWIVGAAPTGDWTGHGGELAGMTGGGWRFLAPQHGLTAWSSADDCPVFWNGSEWKVGEVVARSITVEGQQVVGSRQPAVALPVGGAVIDTEARTALQSVVGALVAHGLIHP